MVTVKAKADRAAACFAAHQLHVQVATQALVGSELPSTVMAPTVDHEASPATITDVPSQE